MLCISVTLNGSPHSVAGAPFAELVEATVRLYPDLGDSWLNIRASVTPENQPPADAHWLGSALKVGDLLELRVIDSAEPTVPKIGRIDPTVRATDEIPFVCGFCDKPAIEVDGMIEGNRAMICHDCVRMLHEMLDEGNAGV